MRGICMGALLLAVALTAFTGTATASGKTEAVLGTWKNERQTNKTFTLTKNRLVLPSGLAAAVDIIEQKDGTIRVVNEGSSHLLCVLTLVDPDHLTVMSILEIGGDYARLRQ